MSRYPYIYLNKKEKFCKAKMNEWIIIKYRSFKKASKRFPM